MTTSADTLAQMLQTLKDREVVARFDIRADGSVSLATGRVPELTSEPAGTTHEFTRHADVYTWAIQRLAAATVAQPAVPPVRRRTIDEIRADRRCPCSSGYANNPMIHNNQVRTYGRCSCTCHGRRR